MDPKQIKFFRKFFRNYAKEFYSDAEINDETKNNMKLKEEHTYRVYRNMSYISKSLNLNEEDINLAKAIALFHDIGRFEQLRQYKTFSDRRSKNHSEIGLEVLKERGILDLIEEKEREILITAIKFHNVREVPNLDERNLFFCRLIRDADKIDVFKVWLDYFEHRSLHDPSYGMNILNSEEYSHNIVSDILANKISPIENIHTYNDLKLLLLTWIYDINFAPSLNLILRRRYIQKIFEILPKNKEMKKVFKHINLYIKEKFKP